MPRTGNVDWLDALEQGSRRARCPFCQDWHVQDQDLLSGPGACVAVYTRSRKVAIFVRAIERGRVRKPRPEESTSAVVHARQRRGD